MNKLMPVLVATNAGAGCVAPASARPPRVLSIAAGQQPASLLVVFLHGVGADADSFRSVAQALAPAVPNAELLIPEGLQPFDQAETGRQWFSVQGATEANRPARVRQAGTDVSRWLDVELDRRGLTHDRLVVVGFSQGAMVAAWLAVHRSPRPAAAVLFSGRVAEDEAPMTAGTPIPVLLAHGTDDPILSPALVEPGARSLEAWGAAVSKKLYPGLGHQIDAREIRDAQAFLESALAALPAR